jgi:hypothetical protein
LRLEAVEKWHREAQEEATAAAEKRHGEAQEEATAAAEKRHREAQEQATAAAEMRYREAQEEQQQRVAAAAAADRSNYIAKVSSPQNSDLENQGTNLITTSPLAASPAFSAGSNDDRREDHTCRSFLERSTGDKR